MTPLILVAALLAPPGPPPTLLRALVERPAGPERAVAATATLLGRPYRRSPLGEGSGPDPDPRFRLDAFDCVTFVETAIALGNASDPEEAARLLDEVRYDPPIAFDRRHHYVIPQWIPANLGRGWIEDVADAVAEGGAVDAVERFDPARWRRLARAGAVIRGLPRAALPVGEFRARMVPAGRLRSVADRIPEGTIVWVVREDRADRPTRVTHAGLVVIGARGERRVRHATASVGTTRVIEEPFDRFLRRQDRAHPGWPVSGLLMVRIRSDAPRRSPAP